MSNNGFMGWGRDAWVNFMHDNGNQTEIRISTGDEGWFLSFTPEAAESLTQRPDDLIEIMQWFPGDGINFVQTHWKQKDERTMMLEAQAKAETGRSSIPDRRGCVYLLHSNGSYKIGHAHDVTTRVTQISPVMPHPVEVVHWIQCADMVALELQLHERYKSKRLNGEWFELSYQDVEYIKSL